MVIKPARQYNKHFRTGVWDLFCHSVVQYWGQLGEEREWWYPPTVCKSLTYEMFSERLMELISSKRSRRTFALINIQENNDGNFIKVLLKHLA